jgi:hypothetical protein
MASYEFKIVTIERTHLRDEPSSELERLNLLGADGWRMIAVRDDPRDGSRLIFFMERERT